MDYTDKQELKELDTRITKINNMLITPLQNNMTNEKESMLRTELKYCIMKREVIFKNAIHDLESCYPSLKK